MCSLFVTHASPDAPESMPTQFRPKHTGASEALAPEIVPIAISD